MIWDMAKLIRITEQNIDRLEFLLNEGIDKGLKPYEEYTKEICLKELETAKILLEKYKAFENRSSEKGFK